MKNKYIQLVRLLILCFCLGIISKNVSAQKITTEYFDKYWRSTNRKNDVVYYRKIQKVRDSANIKLFLVKDYYNDNDSLQMTGYYFDVDKEIKHGKFTYYYQNGKIQSEGNYFIDKQEGEFKEYYASGQLKLLANYHNDTVTGVKKWREDNSVSEIAKYKNGKLDGNFFTFYPNGKLIRFDIYNDGVFTSGKCFTKTGMDTSYFPHIIKPAFPEGFDKFTDYIRYGVQAKNLSCGWFQGNIYLTAIVDTNGHLIEPQLMYATDRCYLENIYELIEKSPAWTPAKIDGVPKQYRIAFFIYFPDDGSREIELLDLN